MSSTCLDAGPEPTVFSDSIDEAVPPQDPTATPAGASRVANGIEDPTSRFEALATVSTGLHKAGDTSRMADAMSEVHAAAETIPEDTIRVNVLATIAQPQAQTGDTASALTTTAESLATEFLQEHTLFSIASTLASAGMFPAAMSTSRAIEVSVPGPHPPKLTLPCRCLSNLG
ncbi:MAG: hypothetical protein OXN90_19635 [Gemmatimonadota bacterium]|nr:hypothetical protein [Gemmatimonadota bacterium]